jgi:ribosomal-protein-alanine N-acetyltransferase
MEFESQANPGSSFEIVRATWRDLNELRHLEKACFGDDAWPLIDLISVLSIANVVRLKAVIDERMVGFIAGDSRGSRDVGWIATLGVLPAYRRRGIASALLQACEDRLEVIRVRLSVRENNQPALQLYRGFGYMRVGIWPDYYKDKSDAIVLEKWLK